MFEHDDEGTSQVPQVGTKNSYGCLIYPTSVSKEIKSIPYLYLDCQGACEFCRINELACKVCT